MKNPKKKFGRGANPEPINQSSRPATPRGAAAPSEIPDTAPPESTQPSAGPAKTTAELRPGRFQKGKSGNPSGRPAGSRNRATLALQEMMEGEAERITRKAIDMALAGDRLMIKLCLERLLPARKVQPAPLNLPKIEGPQDLPCVFNQVWQAVAEGTLSASEAKMLAEVMEMHRNAIGTAEYEVRLKKLENYAFQR
jgi:hypothetical protein